VEHDFPLYSAQSPKSIVGRLLFSVEFQQICTTTVSLRGIEFELEGKHEHNYYFLLQAQTSESTIDGDITCCNIRTTYESEVNRTFIRIEAIGPPSSKVKLPTITFPTSYKQLSSSCLKIALWRESENSASMTRQRPSISSRDIEEGSDPFSPMTHELLKKIKLAEKLEADVLVGYFYISFPKLLGKEMNIFDKKDASLMNNHLNVRKENIHRMDSDSKFSRDLVRDFSDTMWYSGKVIGKVSGRFHIKGLPFFKQMLCGVHTENGFCVVSSSVLKYEGKLNIGSCTGNSKLPSEVLKFIN